jgi:hypothetical protein
VLSVPADPEIVETWVTGWALSRGTKPAAVLPEGFYVYVGLPEQRARYVLPRFEPRALLDLAAPS